MNYSSIINSISQADSRLVKEALVRTQARLANHVFFAGLKLAYDPTVTFGVKKVPTSTTGGGGLSWAEFAELADKLQSRELTGHDARDAILSAMAKSNIAEWNGWYRLILLKDMKAGFSEGTVNRVCETEFPEYKIPVFECQLAKDCVDDEGNVDEDELKGKKILDTKLDGMRVLTVVYPTGHVLQTSRNGKELVNFTVIREQISKVASSFDVPTVLDAEVMSKSFQDLMKQARRKTNVQANDAVLNLIDIIPLSEFLNGKSTQPQLARLERLHRWWCDYQDKLPNVSILGYEVVDLDTKQGQDRLYEVNEIALAANAEGIMLKDLDAVYECKRSKNWLKMKPFIEVSLTAVDVEEGKPDSKFVGTMGAIIFEGTDAGKFIRVSCGGGYSIQQRAQIWATHTKQPVQWRKKVKGKWEVFTEYPSCPDIVGLVGEVRADAVTKSTDKDHYSLRFPRFKTWRGFLPGEKL
jgi:DNA ligase-1